MQKQTLNGMWTMHPVCKEEDTYMKAYGLEDSYQARIPGSVLSTLLDAGAIEDPYYRQNEYTARDLFWQDYIFERSFEVTQELLNQDVIQLVCYGIDTLADLYINDTHVIYMNNMHRTWRIPVKEYLHEGSNSIRFYFKSTLRYIEEREALAPADKKITIEASGAIAGNQYIRKAHSMFGWDWGAQLPDAGIFRDIEIQAYCTARIDEVKYQQEHAQGQVTLQVEAVLECADSMGKRSIGKDSREEASYEETIYEKTSMEVCVYDPQGHLLDKHIMTTKDNVTYVSEFIIQNPQLWWVNGLGEHPLYTVESRLLTQGEEAQTSTDRIGLRTFTVSRAKDQWGEEFAFMINGVKFFAMGADYIPEDCVYNRITRERMEYLVRSSVKAHYNCLRVWGGGYYPSDEFYDLCDEYGIIVWQDLMYACNVYDVTQEFEDSIAAETADNAKRLRHHASLGLWCGNNEIESAWAYWGNYQTQSQYLRADYIKQFEYILPKALKKADDQTFFWPSSPSSGGCFDEPGAENRGDTHYWEVWHGQKPFSDYQKYFFRFCSEFGFQSFPSEKTVYSYTEPQDRNIFSPVMESHQKNDAANGKMLYYLAENFRYPKDFESLLYVTQVLQAVAIKSGVEHWRRNRGRCMGTLYWQINDNWPVASWSSIDYYGRWKALHYMACRFYEPVAGSIVRIADTDTAERNGGEHFSAVAAHVQNETALPVGVTVTMTLKTFDFKVITTATQHVVVPAFGVSKVLEEDYSSYVQRLPRILTTPSAKRVEDDTHHYYDKKDVFVEAVFTYEDGRVQIESDTLVPYKHVELPQPSIHAEVVGNANTYTIALQSNVYTPFVEVDFTDADVILSDNIINLTDDKPHVISFETKDVINGSFTDATDVKNRLRIRSLRDTY